MKRKARFVIVIILALLAGAAMWATLTQAAPGVVRLGAGSPSVVAYQGEVEVSGAPYTGNGYFKFAVVNATGNTSYWSNDGTSVGGTAPTAGVTIPVSKGLFSVMLGDTTLGGMSQALTANVFSQPNRYLRVWFSSDNITFNLLSPDTRIAAVPYALQAQEAVDADTVDGLHASQLRTHYQNMVVVAKSGGDYTSVQSAIDSISGEAANNQYLVWVAPGVYSETVTMIPYVHLQGAGQKATFITSTATSSVWPPNQATLLMASDVSLRDLTVGNGGTGDSNVALLATADISRTLVADVIARAQGNGTTNLAVLISGSGTSATLQRVNALAENGSSHNMGLFNTNGAIVLVRAGSFTGRGGSNGWGIFNSQSGSMMDVDNVIALGENGSSYNSAMFNSQGGVVALRGGTFTGRGGNQADGVSNAHNSTLTAIDITALAENGDDNYALGNYDVATATLSSGVFTARGGVNNYALSNELTVTMKANNITSLAENGSYRNYGLWNVNNAVLVLNSASVTGRGGENAYGIANQGEGSTLEAESVFALGEEGTDYNYGLRNDDSYTATLSNGTFTGRGGTFTYGIYSGGTDPSLKTMSVTSLGENGSSNNYGLYIAAGTAKAVSSQFNGISAGLYLEGGIVHLGVSQLVGGAINPSSTLTCFQVYDSSYIAYTCP